MIAQYLYKGDMTASTLRNHLLLQKHITLRNHVHAIHRDFLSCKK